MTKPPRLLLVATSRAAGTRERTPIPLLALHERGLDVTVATLVRDGSLAREAGAAGIPVRSLRPRSTLELAQTRSMLEGAWDLVVSCGFAAQLVGEAIATRSGAAHVVVHDDAAAPPAALRAVPRMLSRLVAPHVDAVVATERTQLPRLVDWGFLPARIHLIPAPARSAPPAETRDRDGDPRVAGPAPADESVDGTQTQRDRSIEQYLTAIAELAMEQGSRPAPAPSQLEESEPRGRLRLPRRVVRHWNSAFSRGVGYEFTPRGRWLDVGSVSGYYIDFRAKTVSPSARAPEQLLPAGLAQLALGWWERSLAGEANAPEEFRRACRLLEERAEQRDGQLLWPYDSSVRKYPLAWPPYSALAQAQAASVFARAYVRSGDEHDAELTRGAIRSLLHDDSPLVETTAAGPILEESPGEPESHILNGWIYALWGLRDVEMSLGDADAAAMYERSLGCLRRTIESYDVGWWTRYSLFPHTLVDLAKPFYHSLHVDQADILHQLTGFSEFGDAAQRWRSYDTPLHRARAIGQKSLFVATGYG